MWLCGGIASLSPRRRQTPVSCLQNLAAQGWEAVLHKPRPIPASERQRKTGFRDHLRSEPMEDRWVRHVTYETGERLSNSAISSNCSTTRETRKKKTYLPLLKHAYRRFPPIHYTHAIPDKYPCAPKPLTARMRSRMSGLERIKCSRFFFLCWEIATSFLTFMRPPPPPPLGLDGSSPAFLTAVGPPWGLPSGDAEPGTAEAAEPAEAGGVAAGAPESLAEDAWA